MLTHKREAIRRIGKPTRFAHGFEATARQQTDPQYAHHDRLPHGVTSLFRWLAVIEPYRFFFVGKHTTGTDVWGLQDGPNQVRFRYVLQFAGLTSMEWAIGTPGNAPDTRPVHIKPTDRDPPPSPGRGDADGHSDSAPVVGCGFAARSLPLPTRARCTRR